MKIEFKMTGNDKANCLSVSGDLTSQNGADFKKQLQTLFEKTGDLDLSLRNVESIDVTAIQLIKSFRELTESIQRQLRIDLPDSENLTSLLKTTGLFQTLK